YFASSAARAVASSLAAFAVVGVALALPKMSAASKSVNGGGTNWWTTAFLFIGDRCEETLWLHCTVAARLDAPASREITWRITFVPTLPVGRALLPVHEAASTLDGQKCPSYIAIMEKTKVAIVGLGTVGSGVARLLLDHGDRTARHAGRVLWLEKAVVRD